MPDWVSAILMSVVILTGCQTSKESSPADPGASLTDLPTPEQATAWSQEGKLEATPENAPPTGQRAIRGRVVYVETRLKFVIVDFGVALRPEPGQSLPFYRDGEKAGTIRFTTQPNQFIGSKVVGDVVDGTAQQGDQIYHVDES